MKAINIKEGQNYIHLLSGGVDSSYSLLKLAREIKKKGETEKGVIYPIFFDYGQCAEKVESDCSEKIIKYISSRFHNEVSIENLVNISLKSDLFLWCKSGAFTGKTHVNDTCEIQNRNMVLYSVLMSYLIGCADNKGIKTAEFRISSGFINGEMPDSNKSYFKNLEKLMSSYSDKYSFTLDLLSSMTRQQTIAKIKGCLKGNETDTKRFLSMTISCYAPINGKQCGSCYKCKSLKDEKWQNTW